MPSWRSQGLISVVSCGCVSSCSSFSPYSYSFCPLNTIRFAGERSSGVSAVVQQAVQVVEGVGVPGRANLLIGFGNGPSTSSGSAWLVLERYWKPLLLLMANQEIGVP